MIRTALINGDVVTKDSDFSKYIESISGPGVIEGLGVSATKVAEGLARVPCERSNGETLYPLVYVTSEVEISGEGDVYIEVKQSAIDDGELNNEDGTGIAEVKVGTMPSKNALKLATITEGVVEDHRVFLPKITNLARNIAELFADVEDLDDRVEALEASGAVDHLEESGLVGELYTLNDKLFKQYTPTLNDSTIDCNIGDVANNTQIHIQRQGSGVASNELKLKVKSVGSPTTGLVVEVRKGVQVTVTEDVEAYWYGDENEIIATGSIAYGDITNTYAEFTITLDNEFGGTEGELLDIVVYQTGSIVNASNYYCIACDSTQYSEAFSYVSVNGSTMTRSKLMPYAISDGFAQSLLVKASEDSYESYITTNDVSGAFYYATTKDLFTATISSDYHISGTYVRPRSNGSTAALGGGTVVSGSASVYKSGNIDCIYHVEAGNTVTIGSSGNGNNQEFRDFKVGLPFPKEKNGLPPRVVKEIGNSAEVTLFGNDIDGNFYTNKMIEYEGTGTTATTGSITPGNCVGFLTIKVGDNEYKIPYYS